MQAVTITLEQEKLSDRTSTLSFTKEKNSLRFHPIFIPKIPTSRAVNHYKSGLESQIL